VSQYSGLSKMKYLIKQQNKTANKQELSKIIMGLN